MAASVAYWHRIGVSIFLFSFSVAKVLCLASFLNSFYWLWQTGRRKDGSSKLGGVHKSFFISLIPLLIKCIRAMELAAFGDDDFVYNPIIFNAIMQVYFHERESFSRLKKQTEMQKNK